MLKIFPGKGEKMCQIEDCALCKAGQIFLQENGNEIADKTNSSSYISEENGGKNVENNVSPPCIISKENGGNVANNVSPPCTTKLTSGQQKEPHLSSQGYI